MNQSTMSVDTIALASKTQEASFTSELAELQAREARIAANLLALDGSPQQATISEELLAIQTKKLYRAAGLKSFQAYLGTRRTGLSRSRAYQLIDFAKAREKAELEGRAPPANERQARATKLNPNQPEAFEQYWSPVFKYLNKKFHNCPRSQSAKFAETLGLVAKIFSHSAQSLQEEPGVKTQNAFEEDLESPQKGETNNLDSPTGPTHRTANQASQSLSGGPGHLDEPAMTDQDHGVPIYPSSGSTPTLVPTPVWAIPSLEASAPRLGQEANVGPVSHGQTVALPGDFSTAILNNSDPP
jgi:hypothetical protein